MVRQIGSFAHESGLKAFISGGCVRDLVLGNRVKDVDIAVVGDAPVLARRFASVAGGTIVVYKQFGTATVTLTDGSIVDFATLRKESYPYPGALPVVSSGNVGEDLFRRDFTINAMAIAITPDKFGTLIDHYGGLVDIKRKVIRVMHDQSFIDDPTRILRAVRFEQRFSFSIEPVTLALLRRALRKGVLNTVKPPRLFEEFKKNLKEEAVLENLQRLNGFGALRPLGLPVSFESQRLRMVNDALESLKWGKKNLPDLTQESYWQVIWMVVCDGMSLQRAAKLMERCAFKSVDKDKVLGAISSAKIIKELGLPSLTASESYFRLRSMSPEELIYLGAKTTDPLARSRIRTHLLKWRHMSPKINGDDLKTLGIPSGKIFKDILEGVLGRVVDGRLRLKSQQLAYARDRYQHYKH